MNLVEDAADLIFFSTQEFSSLSHVRDLDLEAPGAWVVKPDSHSWQAQMRFDPRSQGKVSHNQSPDRRRLVIKGESQPEMGAAAFFNSLQGSGWTFLLPGFGYDSSLSQSARFAVPQ